MPVTNYVNAPRGAVQSLAFDWSVGLLLWIPHVSGSGSGGGDATAANQTTELGYLSTGLVYDSQIVTALQSLVASQVESGETLGSPMLLMMGGKTNDGTPSYQYLPLGPAGRSVIVEGNSSGVPLPADDINTRPYTQAFDYSGSNPIYIGLAAQGSSKASAVWQIRKLTFDGSNNVTDVQYASGSTAFNQIWNNRAGFTYS